MWVTVRDGRIVLNSALGRKKVENLRANPRVALSWVDPENPCVSLAIQGRVVEEIVGPQAEARHRERISFLVDPNRVYRHVAAAHRRAGDLAVHRSGDLRPPQRLSLPVRRRRFRPRAGRT